MSSVSAAPPPSDIAQRIADQVAARLEHHAASRDAFVVSVYGEWGIGKTHCLRGLQSHFEDRLQADLVKLEREALERIVVPVFFDPWQYEHEEHLVVPLLKTLEKRLRAVSDNLAASAARAANAQGRAEEFTERAQALGQSLKASGQVVGDVAVALLSGFRFKFAPLKEVFGLDIDFAPKDVFDASAKAKAARDAANKPPELSWAQAFRQRLAGRSPGSPVRPPADTQLEDAHSRLSRRESLYFDVHQTLAGLTNQGPPKLRVVLLIDDLDRCLPEKAIQVLESVKLFLNVEGFSFVLAVDDEIVERGIAHRYRAYQADGSSAAAADTVPISGAEYLEKIVHLPVHLQRWTAQQAEVFLQENYGTLFATKDPAARSEDLCQLVLKAVPLVPRKLIRLAEALDFQRTHFERLGTMTLWNPLHAARVVALQQLYPALYRHVRLRPGRFWRLFDLVRNDFGEPAAAGQSLSHLQLQFDKRNEPSAAKDGTAPAPAALTDTLRENLDLLRLVQQAGQQRSNPDPLELFPTAAAAADKQPDERFQGDRYAAFAQLYLHGLAVTVEPPKSRQLDPAPEQTAAVPDVPAFVERLLYADTVNRREYLSQLQLVGRLPDEVFARLLQQLPANPVRATEIDWLRDVAPLLSPAQLLQLYQQQQVLQRLLLPA